MKRWSKSTLITSILISWIRDKISRESFIVHWGENRGKGDSACSTVGKSHSTSSYFQEIQFVLSLSNCHFQLFFGKARVLLVCMDQFLFSTKVALILRFNISQGNLLFSWCSQFTLIMCMYTYRNFFPEQIGTSSIGKVDTRKLKTIQNVNVEKPLNLSVYYICVQNRWKSQNDRKIYAINILMQITDQTCCWQFYNVITSM